MKLYTFLFFLLVATNVHGQGHVFDTTTKHPAITGARYYSKTDFSEVDTLQLWNYFLDTTYHGRKTDSIKPMARVIFWRTKAIDDSISQNVYDHAWTPYIVFGVFGIGDTGLCYRQSAQIRYYSNCLPPEVGGDMIIVGKYVFLNFSSCLNCQRYDTGVDYCRPVLNYVFSHLDRTKITSLQSLVQQFSIAEGTLPKEDKKGG